MPSLYQFAYESGITYKFGHNSIPNIEITNAPHDADFSRFAMAHDGSTYWFFCFRGTSRDTIYPFAFNGSSYQYRHKSQHGEYQFVDNARDVDPSSFECLHDGDTFRFYLKRLGDPNSIYQYATVDNTNQLRLGQDNTIKLNPIAGFPNDSDRCRWMMLHSGGNYHYYNMTLGDSVKFYQSIYVDEKWTYGASGFFPELNIAGAPGDTNYANAAMLHDGSAYRLYFMKL